MEKISTDKTTLRAVKKLQKYEDEVLQYVSRLLRVWVQNEQEKVNPIESL
jgi:uncharacterized FlgJ-related protein